MLDDPERGICLLDFGLTLPIPYTFACPRTQWEGSYSFMGTHVWENERQSRRDDLEAVGLTIAWLFLGGTLPWIDEEPSEIKRQIQAKEMPANLAKLCEVPAIESYLRYVRSLGVDERPNYDKLLALSGNYAGDCVEKLDWSTHKRRDSEQRPSPARPSKRAKCAIESDQNPRRSPRLMMTRTEESFS